MIQSYSHNPVSKCQTPNTRLYPKKTIRCERKVHFHIKLIFLINQPFPIFTSHSCLFSLNLNPSGQTQVGPAGKTWHFPFGKQSYFEQLLVPFFSLLLKHSFRSSAPSEQSIGKTRNNIWNAALSKKSYAILTLLYVPLIPLQTLSSVIQVALSPHRYLLFCIVQS